MIDVSIDTYSAAGSRRKCSECTGCSALTLIQSRSGEHTTCVRWMETRANPIFHDSSKSSSDRGTDRVRTVTSKVRNKLADIASPDPCYIRTDAFRLGKFLSSRYKCPVVYNFQRVNIQIQYRARFRQVIGNDIRAEFLRSYRRSGFYDRRASRIRRMRARSRNRAIESVA